MNNKTLVILTPGFASSEDDTTCLPPQQVIVRALKKKYPSLNVIVLALEYPYRKGNYEWHGINVISFNGINKRRFQKLLLWRSVWHQLKKLKLQNDIIGILNFWLGEAAFVGSRFAKRNNIKHYTWVLGQDAKAGNKYFSRMNPKGLELIALSDFIAAEVFKNYQIKIESVIPVGIDNIMFDEICEQRDIDVMGAGSLIALKQYDIFISVIHQLKQSFPNIRSVICGKGDEEKKLQILIDKYDLKDNIILKGEIPHYEVIQLMQRTKVFLHTSSYEGFGSVCAEALYAGCHVISFVKPMKHKIEQWHVVTSEDEMKQNALQILQDPSTEYKSVRTYTANDIASQMMALFYGDHLK